VIKRTILATAAAATLLFGATSARAESLAPGQTEVAGFVGHVSDGGGATFGGGVQFAVSSRLLVGGEFAYLTGGNDYQFMNVGLDSHGTAFDANARYLFPIAANAKLTPYVLGGFGILRASVSVSGGGMNFDASDSVFGVNLGGGARFDVGDSWGLQPELKWFISDGSNVRISGAIYYRF